MKKAELINKQIKMEVNLAGMNKLLDKDETYIYRQGNIVFIDGYCPNWALREIKRWAKKRGLSYWH